MTLFLVSFFYYIGEGIKMIIYLDLVIVLNFLIDYLTLVITKYYLKLNSKWYRILLACLIGEVSLITLRIEFSGFHLIVLKLLISVILILVAFGRNKFFKNLIVFYQVCIYLGGLLYLFKFKFRISNNILYTLMIVLLVIIAFRLLLYVNDYKLGKIKLLRKLKITFEDGQTIKLNSFLDTGNSFVEPLTNRSIILVKRKYLEKHLKNVIKVNCQTVNGVNFIECITCLEIEIEGEVFRNVLIGCVSNNFSSQYDSLLNINLIGG